MEILKALVLGAVEGLTEFLPVSSTGHLLLVGHFLGFESTGKSFEVLVQLGAIIAILAVYFNKLVAIAKARWRIERDFQELKREIGLGHDEGRGRRGFHHHASLCIAAYGFLVAERCRFPPERRFDRDQLPAPAVPAGFRSRGAGAA